MILSDPTTYQTVIVVAIGGMVGSVLRVIISLALASAPQSVFSNAEFLFPISTLVINILGSLCFGGFVALSEQSIISDTWKQALTIGFCGGFTTFSTFSWEIILLLKQNQRLSALLYCGLSIVGGVIAALIGYYTVCSFVEKPKL